MKEDAFQKILKISEEFFGTESDPNQLPISQESADKLYSLHPDTVLYKFNEEGEPVAWVVVVPTSVETMNKFLNKEISERELFESAVAEKKFEALYLCGAFVLPEYRRRGYASELLKESARKLSGGKTGSLYSWAYSVEGQKVIDALALELGQEIVVLKE